MDRPIHHPLLLFFFAEITEPSARITNTPFLSSHRELIRQLGSGTILADRSDCKLIAVGVEYLPVFRSSPWDSSECQSSSPSFSVISAPVCSSRRRMSF